MTISRFLFIPPFAIALFLILSCFAFRRKYKRVRSKYGLKHSIISNLKDTFFIRAGQKLYSIYMHLARFTRWDVEGIIRLKLIIFMLVMIILILIKLTNIKLYTDEILYRFDYHSDLIYKSEPCIDEKLAFSQEMEYFRQVLKITDLSTLEKTPKDIVENSIKAVITGDTSELMQPRDTIANKVYYRIYDYYKCRKWNLVLFGAVAFFVSCILELTLLVYNFFCENEAGRELRFLKKLIILNGSIKPVDFSRLLKILGDKAKYHKKVIKEIEEMNKKNSIDNKNIYSSLIRNTKDIDMKLFYEKLDQANNYDFDQAVLNIENEFMMDRRTQARKIRKQTELIHAVGITGFMALIFILIIYLIIPWLEAYNMNQVF
ncbi:MAG: hypothetical protein N3I35_11590 [Clostridia bacterium]|nr:hypothetical protein [Clostridia bacterium]